MLHNKDCSVCVVCTAVMIGGTENISVRRRVEGRTGKSWELIIWPSVQKVNDNS